MIWRDNFLVFWEIEKISNPPGEIFDYANPLELASFFGGDLLSTMAHCS